jgi:hypothetical protein
MKVKDDMPFRRARRALLLSCAIGLVAILGLTLAACGSSGPTKMLNTSKIERAIARSSLEQRGLRAQVSCPKYVEQAKGLNFSCVASLGHVDTNFVVTQTDEAGHVRYEAP